MSDRKTFMASSIEDAITLATTTLGVPSDRLEYEVIDKGAKGFLGIGSRQAIIEAWMKEETVEIPIVPVKPEKKEEKKEEKKPEAAPVKKQEKPERKEAPEKKEAPKAPEKREKKEDRKREKPEKPAPAPEKKQEPAPEKIKTTANDQAHFEEGKQFLLDVFDKMGMKVNVEYNYNEEDNSLDIDLSGDEMGVLIGKRGQTLDSLQYLVSLVVNKSGEHYIRVKLDTENYRERRKETLESLAKNIAYKVKRTKRSVALEPMNPYERRIIHSALQPDNFVMTKSEGEEPYRHVVVFYRRNRNGEEK